MATINIKGATTKKAWERNSVNYSCESLIKYKSYYNALEVFIFKNRGVMRDAEEIKQAFEIDTAGKLGIYFLYNTDRTEVYVGKTEDSVKRIIAHDNNKDEWYHDRWDEAALFITSDDSMTKDEMDNLEAIFIQIFKNYVNDITSLNRKNEKIRLNSKISNDKQISYLEAIIEKLTDLRLLDKNKEIDIEKENQLDKEKIIKEVATLIEDATAEVRKEFTERQVEKAALMDKITNYENLQSRVLDARNHIVQNRILSSVFNKNTLDEVVTPENIAREMVDSLPKELFNSNTKFLDPVCKSGIYLQLIIEKLMSDDLELPINHEPLYNNKLERLKNIINNQVYGIALSESSLCVTLNTLFRTIRKLQLEIEEVEGTIIKTVDKILTIPHIIFIDEYTNTILRKDKNKSNYLKYVIKETFNKQGVFKETEMKFDVIIGNPPYQDTSGRASIYHKFIEESIKIANHVSMITRDNWMSGKAFKATREKLIETGTITDIVHYPNNGEIFKNVSVTVAYFVWRKGDNINKITKYSRIKDGKEIFSHDLDLSNGIIYKSELSKNILDKTKAIGDWPATYNTRSYAFMDQRKRLSLDSKDNRDTEYAVEVVVNKQNPVYVNINNFANQDEVSRYKVICGVIVNEASLENPGNVLTNIRALNRFSVPSESWSLVATFETGDEAVNCKKYISTKFIRFIANQSVDGRSNVTDNTFEFVPLQDFTSQSDIDWSQSITNIDQQLYKKYNLTPEEINYIEATIKTMDTQSPKPTETKPTYTIQDAAANFIHQQLQER